MPQGVLGTHKGEEVLWTAPSKKDPRVREVYFGFLHFASFRDHDIKARNILVGLMGATSIRRQTIAKALGVNRCLISRYTKEMQMGGADGVLRDRRGRKSKVTPEIEDFVRREFRKLYAKRRKDFVGKLIQKVEKKFGATLSSELIRQITKPVREEAGKEDSEKKEELSLPVPFRPSLPSQDEDLGENGEALVSRLEKGFHSRYAGGLLLNAFVGKLTEGVFEENGNE